MKKTATLAMAALLVCALTVTAFAADVSTAPALYPTDIVEYSEGDTPRLHKVYTLSAAAIPTADFVREGFSYTLLDVTRNDQTATDTKAHTETVMLDSQSKDMDKILPLLAATKEVTTADGYTGTLTLDTASIKVEAAGYSTSSRTVTATRSYPNLSDADVSMIPKTIEDNGRTLELNGVNWQEAGGFFHATATYSGKATSKYATGYAVTAIYTGDVSKTTSDNVVYTAIFGGTPIAAKAPIPTPNSTPAATPIVTEAPAATTFHWGGIILVALPIGAGIVLLAVVLIRRIKIKKDWRKYNA